jgi:hypothetical protein
MPSPQLHLDVKRCAQAYQPHHFGRLIFTNADPVEYPARERIRLLRLHKDGELSRGRESHWTFSMNRLIALRGAYVAERLAALRDRLTGRRAA